VTPAIDLEAVAVMLVLTECREPTLTSPGTGDAAPWALWDLADVKVCDRPMTVQVTFTRPSRGDVEVTAISMYPTPDGRLQ
jgi:hypothetical protein